MSGYFRPIDAKTIKEMVDPYSFYLAELSLMSLSQRSGNWTVAGLCPFHEDRQPGSFKVNLVTGGFKCWSCGESGGDIISFLQKRDGISFRETLSRLIEMWGTV